MSCSTRIKMAWGSTVTYFEQFFDKPKQSMIIYDLGGSSGIKSRPAPRKNPSMVKSKSERSFNQGTPYRSAEYSNDNGYAPQEESSPQYPPGGYPPQFQGNVYPQEYIPENPFQAAPQPQEYPQEYPPQFPPQYMTNEMSPNYQNGAPLPYVGGYPPGY